MKAITLLMSLIMTTISMNVTAQDSQGDGVSVLVSSIYDAEEDASYETLQMFTISLPDKYLVHHLLEGENARCQFYKIINIDVIEEDGKESIELDVKSGSTRSVYTYEIIKGEDQEMYIMFNGLLFYGRTIPVITYDTLD